MNNRLKKSLFTGLAALGFVAAAGAVNATTANAKTYAKVVSNKKLTTNANDRNVNFTGNSALYTKAGTLKGARVQASKTTLSGLASSTSSKNNVRAYRVATTNRGSVYYKVVTYDGQYRGWIYGGKSTDSFGGGVKSYNTTTDPKSADMTSTSSSSAASTSTTSSQTTGLTDAQKAATYKIATVGTANDGTQVTYTSPAWTQYKQGRVMTDSTKYKDATFKITDQTTRTREGDLWVKIEATDQANSAANGWIKFSGLTTGTPAETFDANKSVKIAYRDVTTGKTLDKTNTWTTTTANTKQGDTTINNVDNSGRSVSDYITNTGAPTGYAFKLKSDSGSQSDINNLTVTPSADSAKFGDTLTVDVTPVAATTKVKFSYSTGSNTATNSLSASDFALGFPGLTASAQKETLPSGGDVNGVYNVDYWFGKNSGFAKALNDANKSNTVTTIKANTVKGAKNDLTGFFGNMTGSQRYFYVYDGDATVKANASALKNGSTVQLVFDRYTTSNTQLNSKNADINTNTDYVAK
ncbi:hypothetical protein YK48G_08800 [Lentilactobacillus fungorum]|uniref:S-layer protein n=1 Tax=Lentilactobacillus fungorum TaxID=2201250 RepID=A0ABQ3VY22_9LACO|nr:S-layer protein [Lentilactobacillus fungorum]GHP13455.1 hypothetical protein YK48G_08800 [Lentilactobacillus fungorum]